MTGTFSIYWNVGGVEVTKDFITRRNIKKAVLFPRYQGSIGDVETVTAYVGSKEVDPQSNLNLIRLEDSITENSRAAYSGEVTWEGKVYYTSARYFLLTDIAGDYVSAKPEPFYWKHVLPEASIDPVSVAILDSDLNEVNSDSYTALRVEARDASDTIISGSYESCSVFSNYANSYDRETGELNIYFVRYSATNGTTHYQILNPVSAFTAAEVDDISLVTGQLKPWRKVYLLTEGASLFKVETPVATTTYYLTPLEKSRIIVRDPIDRNDTSPWFLNISNGAFNTIRDSQNYSYSIPEFASQTFSPLYPYKVEVDEQAEYLRPDLIKVDRGPMQIDSGLYIMQILIKDSAGNVLYALTTDTAREGDFYEEEGERVFRTIETDNAWVTWDSTGIAGWDQEEGFINLQRDYPDNNYFFVTYYYEETGYENTSLNVNPIFDEEFNDQFYALYIVPIGGDNDNVSQTVALQYIKVDRSGRIVETSQDSSGGNFDLSSTINDGNQFMYYSLSASTTGSVLNSTGQSYVTVTDASSFPSSAILVWTNPIAGLQYKAYSSISSNNINFESFTLTEDLAAGTTFRLHSFVTPYTTSSTNNYQWLILAEVYTAGTSRVDELSIIDLRVPGGIIKEKNYEEAMVIDPRSIWARPEMITSMGQTIPGNSASVIKVPYTLLTEYGGNFTRTEVESIVTNRHLATGIVPIIIYHGAIPNISSISSTTSSVTVSWDSEGSGFSYYIYYSSRRDGPWTRANSVPYDDQVYGNTYTISGLSSGLIYYVTITSVNSDGVEGPKSIPWGIKTRV
jgi:hypothetical protein